MSRASWENITRVPVWRIIRFESRFFWVYSTVLLVLRIVKRWFGVLIMSLIGANYVNLCHQMLFYYLMIKVKVFIEEIQHPAAGVWIIYHIINSSRHANSNVEQQERIATFVMFIWRSKIFEILLGYYRELIESNHISSVSIGVLSK